MNERIRELELQCFVYSDEMKTMRFDREKFAELIVKECVEVGAQAFFKDNRIVPVFPANQIKEHFGVE